MRSGEVFIQMLLAYEMEVICGVPEDTSFVLYEAIHNVYPKIRHVILSERRLS
jgi:hypothetical protein